MIAVIHEEDLDVKDEFYYHDAEHYELLKRDMSVNLKEKENRPVRLDHASNTHNNQKVFTPLNEKYHGVHKRSQSTSIA